MNTTRLAAAAFTAAFAAAASAQKPCSKAEEANAQKAIDRIASWPSLHSTWKQYRHCDKGTVGESFTDAILRLVIDWKNVSQLADAMKDSEYKTFIISHLQSPEAKPEAPDVYSRAKADCPRNLAEWCKELAAAVHEPPAAKPTPLAMPPAATPQPGVPPQAPAPPPETRK